METRYSVSWTLFSAVNQGRKMVKDNIIWPKTGAVKKTEGEMI